MPRLLVLVPHPDDEAYSAAGTLALAARAGWHCTVIAVSAGECGECHTGEAATPAALADLRLRELGAACTVLGAVAGPSPRLPDGGLPGHPGLLAAVSDAITACAPDLLMTLGPDGAYGHPDHLALHRAVVAAVEALPDPPALLFAAFPPGLFRPQYERCRPILGNPPALQPDRLGVVTPDLRVPITAVADVKLTAIAAHRSQLPGGDPHALFPPGIVAALLGEEWFILHRQVDRHRVAPLLSALQTTPGGT